MIKIWTDGSFAVNRDVGIGCVMEKDGKIVREISAFLGRGGSANYAEYAALNEAFSWLGKQAKDEVVIHCDSALVCKQMKGWWKIGNGAYSEEAEKAKKTLKSLEHSIRFVWVPRAENVRADTLSKEAHSHKTYVVHED